MARGPFRGVIPAMYDSFAEIGGMIKGRDWYAPAKDGELDFEQVMRRIEEICDGWNNTNANQSE